MAKKIEITDAQIEAFAAKVASLPAKVPTISTGRKLVERLEPMLRGLLSNGYSSRDLAEMIEKDFSIRLRPETITHYLRDLRASEEAAVQPTPPSSCSAPDDHPPAARTTRRERRGVPSVSVPSVADTKALMLTASAPNAEELAKKPLPGDPTHHRQSKPKQRLGANLWGRRKEKPPIAVEATNPSVALASFS